MGKIVKMVKFFHLIGASGTFGGLLSMITVLLLKGRLQQTDSALAVYDNILINLHAWAFTFPFILLAISTLLYGLITEWGFIRHYWIIAKWLLMVSMLLITLMVLGPSLNGIASISDADFYKDGMAASYASFYTKSLISVFVELSLLAAVFFISVTKPWGKQKRYDIKPRTALMILLPASIIGSLFGISNMVMLNRTRNLTIRNIAISNLPDGVYKGHAEVGRYTYRVKVAIERGRITDVTDIAPRKSIYADYARGVFAKMVKEQRIDVDAVTGATTTSKAYMKAVENALEPVSR